MFTKVKQFIKKELLDYKMLLRNVPSPVVTIFVVSCIVMNQLANREWLNLSWVALDCGFFLSWISFLCMDVITKRFGAKAAIKISAMGLGVNFIVAVLLFSITRIPGGSWSAAYSYPNNATLINAALDETFGGTWFVLLGSTLAMFVASIVNSITNELIGKVAKGNTFKHFAIRSYVSTMLGQFVDNLVFAFVVSHTFFGWTAKQCAVCAITGAVFELLGELIFSPIGFKLAKNWDIENVGQDYLNFIGRGK